MMTKFFTAIAAIMMTISSANATNIETNNSTSTNSTTNVQSKNNDDVVLPNITVVATGKKKTVFIGNDKKYDYNLDDQDRVSTKVLFKKNYYGDWSPISAYSVFYGQEETVLSYAEYDNVRKTYTINAKQTRYNAADFPVIIKVPQE